ncbi:MAG: pyridoxamine 5'-phosphate oxidase family protein [archaeon]|nr:pyridoxamine 5'-phosphate oxidase family protein [archaeon]
MTNFDKFCDKMAAMPLEAKTEAINSLTKDVLIGLAGITEDGASAVSIYTDFIMCAVAADGKLAEEEFLLIKPLFDAAAEKDVSYEEAVAIFRNSGLDDSANYKKTVDLMVDLIGEVSEELKNSIVTLCFLICAIDGEVSAEEKDWIRQLVDDNFGLSPMETVEAYLDDAKTFVLATSDNGQPRMRVLGFKCVVDGRIFFAVGTFKDVYKQLVAEPRCEILADVGMEVLRWDGKAVFYEDPRFDAAFTAALPQIAAKYRELGVKIAFFTLENGSAEIVGVDNSKKRLF